MKTEKNELTMFTKASFRQRRKHLFPTLKTSNYRHSWWEVLPRAENILGWEGVEPIRNIKKT
jgi:16S rRNA A1518/A1519 N6-dimethyltransferase RsmA/KsgA/DIM1 with predicted DNA glycosylase/AP lyase activity